MKTIKIISDLHINNQGGDNDFFLNDGLFIKYLKDTIGKIDYFVFNGDIFECWKSRSWGKFKTKFWNIVREKIGIFTTICDGILKDKKITYIYGNHDKIVYKQNLIPHTKEELILNIDGQKIYIAHGHQPDLFNSRWPIIGTFCTWFLAFFERLGWGNIDKQALKGSKKALSREAKNKKIFHKYAKEIYKKHHSKVIVFGHTHKHEIVEFEEFTYVNTGKSCHRKNKFDEITLKVHQNNIKISHKLVDLSEYI